jgi:hypothetical protein
MVSNCADLLAAVLVALQHWHARSPVLNRPFASDTIRHPAEGQNCRT